MTWVGWMVLCLAGSFLGWALFFAGLSRVERWVQDAERRDGRH